MLRIKLLSVLALIMIITSCSKKPDPTFNPFDSIFDVNFKQLEAEVNDTIWGECGYVGLAKNMGDYSPSYQVFIGEDTIQAKMMDIYLDTFFFPENPDNYDSALMAFDQKPIDTARVDEIMARYGLTRNQIVLKEYYSFWYYADTLGQLHKLEQHINRNEGFFTKELNYHRFKPNFIN